MHCVNVSRKVLTKIRLPEIFYCVYNVDTRHPILYCVTTVDYLLTASVTDCWSAVLSTSDPQSSGLKLKCESCLSKSGFYGFPRFKLSSVRPIKLIHNRVQPLASAVPLSHFSKHSSTRLCKHDALYEVSLYPVSGQYLTAVRLRRLPQHLQCDMDDTTVIQRI